IEENLEATHVANVTDSGRVRMYWNGTAIVDMSRDFIETNGVKQKINIKVRNVEEISLYKTEENLEIAISSEL
ncbi:hypothetical protein L0M92_15865, partial [Casaltella massiliensis]|nr:hypothetical protein [Casaltella massiliensis]